MLYSCRNGVQFAVSYYNFSKITRVVNCKNPTVQLNMKSKFPKKYIYMNHWWGLDSASAFTSLRFFLIFFFHVLGNNAITVHEQ